MLRLTCAETGDHVYFNAGDIKQIAHNADGVGACLVTSVGDGVCVEESVKVVLTLLTFCAGHTAREYAHEIDSTFAFAFFDGTLVRGRYLSNLSHTNGPVMDPVFDVSAAQ